MYSFCSVAQIYVVDIFEERKQANLANIMCVMHTSKHKGYITLSTKEWMHLTNYLVYQLSSA